MFSLIDAIRRALVLWGRLSIGMCLKVAPNKIIHQIKVGTAGRPLILGDEVVAVLHWARSMDMLDTCQGAVLLPDPGASSCYVGDPG